MARITSETAATRRRPRPAAARRARRRTSAAQPGTTRCRAATPINTLGRGEKIPEQGRRETIPMREGRRRAGGGRRGGEAKQIAQRVCPCTTGEGPAPLQDSIGGRERKRERGKRAEGRGRAGRGRGGRTGGGGGNGGQVGRRSHPLVLRGSPYTARHGPQLSPWTPSGAVRASQHHA